MHAAAGWRCAAGRRRRCCPRWCARSAPTPSTAARRRPASHARATTGWTRRSATCRSCGIPGIYIADLNRVLTKDGRPYTVFSPFLRTLDAAGAPLGRAGAPRDRAAVRREGRPDAVAGVARVRRRARPPRSPAGLGGRGPDGGEALGALGDPRLRDGTQRPGRRHLAPVGAPAVRDAVAAVARGARPRRRRPRRRACTAPSSPGATSTARSCCTTRRRRGWSSRSATGARWSGTTTPTRSRPGRRARPAIRSWTPPCASCASWAGCTTARG